MINVIHYIKYKNNSLKHSLQKKVHGACLKLYYYIYIICDFNSCLAPSVSVDVNKDVNVSKPLANP